MSEQRDARVSRRAVAAAFWLGVSAAVTLLLWLLRERVEQAHMALAYLLVMF